MSDEAKSDEATMEQSTGNGLGGKLLWGIAGLVLGVILCGGGMFLMMPKMMLTIHQSRFDTIEETCAQLQKAIEKNGWSCPAIRDMKTAMAKHGVSFPNNAKIVELCKAEYAKEVLLTNPEVLTLMPCAWGVYKGPDGKVYISGMNMGLMGKMFGGTIAKVMGTSVAADEKKMFADVVVK